MIIIIFIVVQQTSEICVLYSGVLDARDSMNGDLDVETEELISVVGS
jgi:hypothetical protein